ncbi:MAG TPA: ATP-binding protein, partial [Isosphaeraceae bacterium]|nr:ATP-binding protein [Isosphaeraceae bacterium]
AVYLVMRHSLLERIDSALVFEYEETAEALRSGRLGRGLAVLPEVFLRTYLLRVVDESGMVVLESPSIHGLALPSGARLDGSHRIVTTSLGRLGSHRLLSGQVRHNGERMTVWIARSLDLYDRDLNELRATLWTILPAGLVLAVAGGYQLAARALRPVGRMAQAARMISASNLHQRIEVSNPSDELGRLAATLNAMLDRIDSTFAANRRFTADASHELKTPITAIRTEAEVAIYSSRTVEALSEVLESIVEEADRLARLADRLLALSREDAGFAQGLMGPVRLDELLVTATERIRGPAERLGLSVEVENQPPLILDGDADRLREVLDNLLENAQKYNRPPGFIRVRLRSESGRAVVEVIDSGVGISPEAIPRIFDRFYRVESSRSRRTGGVGLGLSIVKAIVEAHGGRIEVESQPGQGSTFRVILPGAREV